MSADRPPRIEGARNTGRLPAKAFDANGQHIGPGPWLNVIHRVNEICPDTFGQPISTGDWWAGGYVEEYATARVIHHTDETVSIAAKDSYEMEFLLADVTAEVLGE